MTHGEHEVVVVGGGPAGAACARRLARHGHDVLLAERAGRRPRPGETCGPRVRRLLDDAGAPFPQQAHRPLAAITSAWAEEQLERRCLPFWYAENGLVLDRAALDRWLLEAAQAAGARVVRGCTVTGGRPDGRGAWQLDVLLDGRPRTLRAGFVVEATGRAARSVTHPDMRRWSTDALVCLSVELPDRSGDDDVLVEACRQGWWYTVRLSHGERLVALFTDADLVPRAPDRSGWYAGLLGRTVHVRHTVADPRTARLHGCSARSSIRRLLWRERYLAVGDAACFLDPLSGTGVERAVTDGIAAADALSATLGDGDGDRLREHALGRARAFREGLAVQGSYYGAVHRWAEAAFWRRRVGQVG